MSDRVVNQSTESQGLFGAPVEAVPENRVASCSVKKPAPGETAWDRWTLPVQRFCCTTIR